GAKEKGPRAGPSLRDARGHGRAGRTRSSSRSSGFGLVLDHLTATVEAVGADVVTQMGFARGGLDGDARHGQRVVRTVHATLGRRLLVLLDSHDGLLGMLVWDRRAGSAPAGAAKPDNHGPPW